MMAEALRRAAPSAVLAAADSVWTVMTLTWRYPAAAALVAGLVGATPRDTAVSPMGGNEPQSLVLRACRDILAGERDVVLIAGAEAWRSRSNPGGEALGWTPIDKDAPRARKTGEELPLSHPAEAARAIVMPTQTYPLFEQAFRHSLGRSVADHMAEVSRLWSRFSEVAAGNPHAWIQQAMTPAEISTPGPTNRWISWPYTKVMNSNNAVEQAAGVVVTSVERATSLGVPRDQWVFPWTGAEAHDHYAVSNRADLASSPAIRLAGRALFAAAGVGPDDVAHADLYSCFPSAVQIAASELGLPTELDRTVTGGLSFAGGPWNNYVSHSMAAMVDVLRADPGSLGLVTANGGHLTKHALALYSTEPPAGGFRWQTVQDEVDALPARELCEAVGDAGATGRIESWVVSHDREAVPERAIATVLLDDGRRAWSETRDPDTMSELMSGEDFIDRPVKLPPDHTLVL
jgi:acetyl-CoA C-acetyltransferase